MKAQELLAGGIGGRSPACLQMRQHPQAAGEKPAHACINTTWQAESRFCLASILHTN